MENVEEINPKSDWGLTPLHHAASSGHQSICELIIKDIKDKNQNHKHGQLEEINTNGSVCTPLHIAAFQGHLSIY